MPTGTVLDVNVQWTNKYINDLPDSAFLFIENGGTKDSADKTVPRNFRHFPYKNSAGNVDLPHLRNALAMIPQSNMSRSVKTKTASKARKVLKTTKKATQNQLTLNTFQNISMNFTGMVRHDTMEGRDYLVAPMVMLKEGVLNGSNGRLYYPADELAKTPVVWNQKPIIVYHPIMNGVGVSACDPDIITNRKIGVIMNTNFTDGKLKGEAWLEESRVEAVDNRIMEAIDTGEMMELSTGLFTDVDKQEGEFNGEPYDGITRNYRPDHLALLPDLKGACSLEDGAGFMRNQENGKKKGQGDPVFAENQQSHDNLRQALSVLLRAKFPDAWEVDVFDGFFIYEIGGKHFKQPYLEGEISGAEFVGEPVEVLRVTEYRTLDGTVVGNNVTRNARGEGQGQGGPKQGDGGTSMCICPDCGTETVHNRGTPCTQQTCPKCGSSMMGIAVSTQQNKEPRMNKKEEVDKIIKNSAWTEEDRGYLMELNEDQLTKLSAGVKPEEPEKNADPVAAAAEAGTAPTEEKKPEENQEMTAADYIAKAPIGIRDMLSSGLSTHNQSVATMVKKIMANEANSFTQEALIAMPLEQLQGIAAFAAPPEKESKVGSVADYLGQGDAGPTGNAEKEEPLVMAAMDFTPGK